MRWTLCLTLLGAVLAGNAADKPASSSAPALDIKPADTARVGQLPPYTSALSERATKAITMKRWNEARAAYLEMLKDDPNNALTLSNLGSVEQGAGHPDAAKEYYAHAVSLNPGLTQVWISLGLICFETDDSYMAVSALTRAVHDDPTDAKSHNFLAVALQKMGWLDAAEAELQRAIEIEPSYANAHFNLALMYLERKPPAVELARRHYQKALSLGAPKDEDVEAKLKEK